MNKTALLMPLAASLLLGTAAFAQDQAPAPANEQPMNQSDQQMPQQQAMPEGGAMQNASMSDPRQSSMGGMPIDQETTVSGIQAACTGVGDQQENSARWRQYPVKVVVSGTGHQFFAGETVSITRSGGEQVAQMTCNAPWVLMKLQPGSYHATVDLPGHPAKTVAFTAPSRGQREVNVVYTGSQEASDQTGGTPDQHRATDTSYQSSGSMDNGSSAPMNAAPPSAAPSSTQPMTEQDMKNATPDQSPNNSDQPTQQPQ